MSNYLYLTIIKMIKKVTIWIEKVITMMKLKFSYYIKNNN